MIRPWRNLLAIVFALALVAAACGDSDDDSSDETTPAAADDAGGDDGGGDDAGGDDGGGDDGGDGGDGGGDDGGGDDAGGDDGGGGDAGTVPDSPDDGVTSDSIKIGWMGDLTGPTASSQSFNSHGVEAYVECLNERGGLLGRTVEYLPEDDQFSAETAAVNFTKLVDDDNVLALLGLGGSHISTQLMGDVDALNLPIIGPPQTIDVQLDGDQVFNNLAHYGDQADLAVGQIGADVGGPENAVVMGISLEVPSGQEFAAYVEESVGKTGGTYVGTLFVAPGATEVTAQMVELQAAIDDQGVNYVTLHGSPGAALVVMQGMADAGITEIPIIGIHGVAANSVFIEGPADVTDQAFGMHSFLTSNNPTDASEEMARCATLAGYDGEDLTLNFTHGYLNGYIFEQAVLRAAESGELTRESLTEALRGEFDTMGLTCPIDWSSSQHSQCGAAFSFDAASGGMLAANPFDFYADGFDGEYGIEFG